MSFSLRSATTAPVLISTRDADPLAEADDAVLVDTTGLTIDQVVEKIEALLG